MDYFDASAKLNQGVTECFEALMTQVYKKKVGGEIMQGEDVDISKNL